MNTSQSADSVCHRTVCYFTHWSNDLMLYVNKILHAWLFFLFADVICLFADDFKNFSMIAKLLCVWSSFISVTDQSSLILPSVVIMSIDMFIVISNSWKLKLMKLLLFQNDAANLKAVFSCIRLIHLHEENLSSSAQFQWLKKFFAQQSDEMQVLHIQESMLFSAKHMSRLFNLILQHTLTTITQLFNFISASQEYCKPLHDHQLHLIRFFHLEIQYYALFDELAFYVAFSFLMNTYLSEMHSMSSLKSDEKRIWLTDRRIQFSAVIWNIVWTEYCQSFCVCVWEWKHSSAATAMNPAICERTLYCDICHVSRYCCSSLSKHSPQYSAMGVIQIKSDLPCVLI